MAKPLVVVESPAKAKTISKFLGDAYDVRASVGHVADLPSKGLNIDVDNGFKPTYELTDRGKTGRQGSPGRTQGRLRAVPRDRRRPRGRGDLVAPRRVPEAEGAGQADGVPRDHQGGDRSRDRQPARHRLRPRRRRRDPSHPRPPVRLRGVAGAVASRQPGPVGRPRAEPVDPSDRRTRTRADRLRRRRTTGTSTWSRRPIRRSTPSWSRSTATRSRSGKDFDDRGQVSAKAVAVDEARARALAGGLEDATFSVRSVEEKPYRSSPKPPFMTSTLQQEGGRKLRLSSSQVMRVAQGLYERGFITYMRTDSVTLSDEAMKATRGGDHRASTARTSCHRSPSSTRRSRRTPRRRTRRSGPPRRTARRSRWRASSTARSWRCTG